MYPVPPLDGMTLFFTDLDRQRITVREIEKLVRVTVDSNELFIDNLEVRDDEVVGQVGQGLRPGHADPRRLLLPVGLPRSY